MSVSRFFHYCQSCLERREAGGDDWVSVWNCVGSKDFGTEEYDGLIICSLGELEFGK